MSISCIVVCCVSSCLYNELITHSQQSYMYVCVCNQEISTMRWPGAEMGCCMTENEYDSKDRDLQISYYRLLFCIHIRTSNTTFHCNLETRHVN